MSPRAVQVATASEDGSEADDVVTRAGRALRNGEVVVIPTDTVYGLAAALDRPDAIGRLYAMKERPAAKAIPVLIDDVARVHRLTPRLSSTAARLAERFWPGALTLVLPAMPGLPSGVTTMTRDRIETVAVRVPDNALARSIIAAAGGALAVTSANRSGAAPALEAGQVTGLEFSQSLLIVDGGRASGGVPSTIVDVTSESAEILREGAIPAPAIAAAIANSEPMRGDEARGRYDERMMQHKPADGPEATS